MKRLRRKLAILLAVAMITALPGTALASTDIVIAAQELSGKDEGTHTLAQEFRDKPEADEEPEIYEKPEVINRPEADEEPKIYEMSGTNILVGGIVGQKYSAVVFPAVVTTHGTVVLEYTVADGKLPAGLTLDSHTGEISGIPTTAGEFVFTVDQHYTGTIYGDHTFSGSVSCHESITIEESKETSLPDGVKYVPYSYEIGLDYPLEVVSGTLPYGLSVDPWTCELFGTPQAAGEFSFTVRVETKDDTIEQELTLKISEDTAKNVGNASAYKVITPIGTPDPKNANHFILDRIQDETLALDAPYANFMRLLIDGKEQVRGVDYDAEEGSTVLTIYHQTLGNLGEGDHTLAQEFREGGKKNGKLTTASQTVTITKKAIESTKSSAASKPSVPASGLPFGDVDVNRWFYPDVKWIYDAKIMSGTTASTFSPNTDISQAVIVTVLSRIGNVDLTRFNGSSDSSIEDGKWYTNAAIWAKQSGLLPDRSAFTGEEAISRDQMAIMLVKYLRSMGKDTTPPTQAVAFADAGQMSQDGNDAFQILYHYDIFRGFESGKMEPAGSTTRAQFAALAHRLSDAAKA